MAAAAELLGQRGEILVRGGLVPRIGAQGNLRANLRGADADRVDAFRMQQVGDEFVVALEVQITDIEKDYVVASFAALPKNLKGSRCLATSGSLIISASGR